MLKRNFEIEHLETGTIQDLQHVATVGVHSSLTLPIGDGVFIKTGISMTMPCEPTKKARMHCYNKISEEVAKLLETEYHNTKVTKESLQ